MTQTAPMTEAGALDCHDVTVRYGDVTALTGVSVGFQPGMIHAVVGQNGAGKTTFARVCAGIVRPVTGHLAIGGVAIHTGQASEARMRGVELVHQSFALPPSFTVAEVMEFGSRKRGWPIFTRRGLMARWRRHLNMLGVRVPLDRRIRDLPIETQQSIEIARALSSDARILILDEPTAVLPPAGIDALFARLRDLRDQGVTILLILHKIREVLAIAETVTVLRAGHLIHAPRPVSGIDAGMLAASIVGAQPVVEPIARFASIAPKDATPALQLTSVNAPPVADGPALDGIDLTVQRGEIVGIAGVEGNGQQTLVRAIAGLIARAGGNVQIGGTDVTNRRLRQRRDAGLRIIPFERNVEGLSLGSALWENWSMRHLLMARYLSFIPPKRLKEICGASLKRWDVRYASVDQPAGALSGGNAQKVILAREIDEDGVLLIAAQPTRGLDIGATAFVWQSLRDIRERGAGVLLISSDLDELFDISDRIVVMLSGRVVAEFTAPYDRHIIGAAMTGAKL